MKKYLSQLTNIQFLLASFAVGNSADGMSLALFPLITALLIKNPLAIASVLALRTLPWLILSIPAGIMLDRFNRKKIMIIANTIRGVTILLLGYLPALPTNIATTLIFPAAFIVGACEVFYDTGVFTAIPDIVPKERLLETQGFLASTEMVAKAGVGAMIGAMIFSHSPWSAIALNAALYLLSGKMIHLLPLHTHKETVPTHIWQDLTRGFSIIGRSKTLTGLSIISAINNTTFFAITSTLVVYLKDILKESNLTFSLVNSSIAIGLFTGGLAVGRLAQKAGRTSSYFMNLFLFSTALVLIALFPNATMMFFGFLIVGIAWGIGNSISAAYRQATVERRDLGKVSAFSRLISAGVQPLASIAGGWLVLHVTYQHAYIYIAAFSLLSLIAFWLFIRLEPL